MMTLKEILIIAAFSFSYNSYTMDIEKKHTIPDFLEIFDNVQRLPNVLKYYIAHNFITPISGAYIEKEVLYLGKDAQNSEPFLYGPFEGQLPSRSLYYKGNKKIETKAPLATCYINLVGPNQKGFFIVESTIKNVNDNNFEFSLSSIKTDKMITALFPSSEHALSLKDSGKLFKHTFGHHSITTEQLYQQLPPKRFAQLIVTDNAVCIARVENVLYFVPLNQKSYKEIKIADIVTQKTAQELWKNLHRECSHSIFARFSHMDYTHAFPDHLFIEILISSLTLSGTIKKNMIYHMPSSEWTDLESLKSNNYTTRWLDESLSHYARHLHSITCTTKNRTRNIIHTVSQPKMKVMLQAYLILSAAQLWNRQKNKSKQDAGNILKRLKQIQYAGCIYTVKGFKKIFDEMRKESK